MENWRCEGAREWESTCNDAPTKLGKPSFFAVKWEMTHLALFCFEKSISYARRNDTHSTLMGMACSTYINYPSVAMVVPIGWSYHDFAKHICPCFPKPTLQHMWSHDHVYRASGLHSTCVIWIFEMGVNVFEDSMK